MNSPLQRHKVRLRGLGGPAVCGVRDTCASATSLAITLQSVIPKERRARPSSVHKPGARLRNLPSESSWPVGAPVDPRSPSAKADLALPQRRIHSLLARTPVLVRYSLFPIPYSLFPIPYSLPSL
jgi:hypothetical protein